MIANGDPLGLELVECLSGFFIQVFVTGQPELLEDIQDALPLMARQLHLGSLHLDLLHREHRSIQVHAFIPGNMPVVELVTIQHDTYRAFQVRRRQNRRKIFKHHVPIDISRESRDKRDTAVTKQYLLQDVVKPSQTT